MIHHLAARPEILWRLSDSGSTGVVSKHLSPFERVTSIGAVRKKAIVAVARRLAVDLWRLHTGRCSAEQLGLKF